MSRRAGLDFDDDYAQSSHQVQLGVLAQPLRILLNELDIDSVARCRSNIDRSCLGLEFFLRLAGGRRKDGGRVFEEPVDVLVVEEVDDGGANLSLARGVG